MPLHERSCPFCNPAAEHIMSRNELAYVQPDINPVSRGHMLIIPFRHVSSFFDVTREEQAAILALVHGLKEHLDTRYHPTGYNIGVNVGEAAGQTIMHVHFHLIPRYTGDARGQRSGLRHVIPKPCVWQRKISDFYPVRVNKGMKRE
jgi:diadenosine tetraphosphate (Ap4A) HIT family hydrolase